MEGGGAAKVDLLDVGGGDGFAVGAGDGAVFRYPHVTGLAAAKAFKIQIHAAAAVDSSVEISFKSAPGPQQQLLLLRCDVLAAAGGLAEFTDVECGLVSDAVTVAAAEDAELQ